MIQTSEAYRDAIVGSPRRMELLVVVDISDPDRTVKSITASGEAPWSRLDQTDNYETESTARRVTLERNRWLLDGAFHPFPANYRAPDELGFVSDQLSGPSGAFLSPVILQRDLFGVQVLQAVTIYFSDDILDGVGGDFTVDVLTGSTVAYSREFSHNTAVSLMLTGFTVYTPTAVRLTITRWSLPYRRARVLEFRDGIFERWTNEDLAEFTATLQGQFSCLSLPYGSVTLAMDNADRRFEPRRKDSIFQSIEERQGVDIYIGCQTEFGVERVRLGVFYQAKDGWSTSNNDIIMKWYLVDIIGLISDRTFIVPDSLPTTLEGWIRALVSQIGVNFTGLYHVDPDYANKPVVANSREDVTGKKCGDILRWACQATGTWPRADQETGKLTAEPLWNQGNKLTLDNLNTYPAMKANESLAALIFQIGSGESVQEFVVSGNSTTSEKTVTIVNPFIHSSAEALAAARLILAQYGGSVYELTGRGDPSSEIGDVDTIWLDESNAATARRMSQTFQIQNGVLQNCRSTLLQADGSYLWEEFAVIRASGTFTAPPGVHRLRIVLGQGGQGGGYGEDGYIKLVWVDLVRGYGAPGQDGQGGAIWYGVIDCNEGQEFNVVLGRGGAAATKAGVPGELGEHTTFGMYSSENGRIYENGYTDIANGQAFARTGVPTPLPGTGDGGKGGAGGDPGVGRKYKNEGDIGYRYEIIKQGGPGHPGVAGATGFAMVTWEKPGNEQPQNVSLYRA